MDEYIAGKHSVLEALRSKHTIQKIFVGKQAQRSLVQPIMEAAKEAGVIVQMVDKRKLDQLVGDVQHQGVVAQAAAYDYAELDDLLELARKRSEAPFLLILDELEDPHNLGSILRTADCTGVHGIIIPKRRSVGLTATVSKTSAGAIEYIPVTRVTNISKTIEELKKQGVWVVGTDVEATDTMYSTDLTMSVALVIGNENKGISRLVKEKCDFLVRLPMKGKIDSLNASVAAGVMMYEVLHQRETK